MDGVKIKSTEGYKTVEGFHWFPGRSTKFSSLYYQKKTKKAVETLKTAFVNYSPAGGQHGASLYSELVAGYAGPVRLSFGSMLSVVTREQIDPEKIDELGSDSAVAVYIEELNQENLKNNSLMRLFSSGGNMTIMGSMPFLDYSSPNEAFRCNLLAGTKFAFDIPEIGVNSNQFSFVNEWNLQTNFIFNLSSGHMNNDRPISLLLGAKGAVVTGSKDFFDNLELDGQTNLGYVELTGGIKLNDFVIRGNVIFGSDKTLTSGEPVRFNLSTSILINDLMN
jgi:hypothetical protein